MSYHNLKPLSEVMKDLKDQGYAKDFMFRDNHLVLIDGDHRSFDHDELVIAKEYRFEGDSDPGMMTILYALESKDGIKGTISNGYGANSDEELGEFMIKVREL